MGAHARPAVDGGRCRPRSHLSRGCDHRDRGRDGIILPYDLPQLEQLVLAEDAALILLDPLMSRLDRTIDSHKDAEARLALEPVVSLGDKTGATIMGLIHVNKGGSQDALTTLMGSRAFVAVARSVLFVMTDPDDEHTRLVGLAKNNLGRIDLVTLKFSVDEAKVADTDEGPVLTGKLHWQGETTRTIRDVLETMAADSGDKTATTEAQAWLEDYLNGQGGTASAAPIKRAAAEEGHSREALRRARKRLGVTITEVKEFPRRTVWALRVSTSSGRVPPTVSTVPTVLTRETSQREMCRLAAVDTVSTVSTVNANSPGVESTGAQPRMGVSAEAWARHHVRPRAEGTK